MFYPLAMLADEKMELPGRQSKEFFVRQP